MKHTSIFLKATCRRSIALLCTAVLFTASVFSAPLTADAASPALVILSRYRATLKIGDSFTLAGIASNGKWVRFKSSKSAVASVNTYGRVTAKKAGTCTITGKVAGGEASCKITVTKTQHGRAYGIGAEGLAEQSRERDARDDGRNTERDTPRKRAHVRVIAAGVFGRGIVRGGRFGGSAGEVPLHELVERAVEDGADLEQLVHLGVGPLRLPLGHGLAAHAEQHGKVLLGHAAGRAKMLEVFSEAHGWPLLGRWVRGVPA